MARVTNAFLSLANSLGPRGVVIMMQLLALSYPVPFTVLIMGHSCYEHSASGLVSIEIVKLSLALIWCSLLFDWFLVCY